LKKNNIIEIELAITNKNTIIKKNDELNELIDDFVKQMQTDSDELLIGKL
jgi:hypothetical protein